MDVFVAPTMRVPQLAVAGIGIESNSGRMAQDALVNLVASAEKFSEHPLGQAIVEYANAKGLALAASLTLAHWQGMESMRAWTAANSSSVMAS